MGAWMLNKILVYVIIFLASTTLFYFGISKYRQYQVEDGLTKIDEMKTEAVVVEVKHEVKVFEANQTNIFNTEKEIKDEVVPSSIGFHTITIK